MRLGIPQCGYNSLSMSTAVDQILAYNARFDKKDLPHKLDMLVRSPFQFFRGTFHLFTRDLKLKEFRSIPMTRSAGPIVGDLHSQNFGIFRAVHGGLTADINDFDETTHGPYEFDLRRLATSLMLGAIEQGATFSEGIFRAEDCARSYVDALRKMSSIKNRQGFEAFSVPVDIKQKPRIPFIKSLVKDMQFIPSQRYQPVDKKTLASLREAFPRYQETCVSAENEPAEQYRFVSAATRVAGIGSLGRKRYAILICIEKGEPSIENLRLVEWKQSLDSAHDEALPHAAKSRAKQVVTATKRFQLHTKRFIGYTRIGKMPMQARELGVNDQALATNGKTYGEITARAHLLGAMPEPGPRTMLKEIAVHEDDFIRRLIHFSVAYTEKVLADYRELLERQKELRKRWIA